MQPAQPISEHMAATLAAPDARPAPPQRQRWWGRAAMALLPRALSLLGYTFRAGRGPEHVADAEAVLDAVWSAPSAESAAHRSYLEAPTWILGYRHGQPIACMGLYDVRERSFSLNHLGARPPRGMDPATYRDLSRLAIVPSARGGARVVMLGLLHGMARWCRDQGVTHILAISVPSLFPVFERYNPSARRVTLEPAAEPLPRSTQAYHDRIAAKVGPVVSYTFDLRAFDALRVIVQTLSRPLRRRRPPAG